MCVASVEPQPRPAVTLTNCTQQKARQVPVDIVIHKDSAPQHDTIDLQRIPELTMATRGASVTVGVLSLGDMGAGIARLLMARGFAVATNCQGRRYVMSAACA